MEYLGDTLQSVAVYTLNLQLPLQLFENKIIQFTIAKYIPFFNKPGCQLENIQISSD